MSTDGVRITASSPVLTVGDLERAVAYYREALGFELHWTWGDPSTRAGVGRDGFELQLAQEHGPPGPSTVYFTVTGVDAYYRECRERGARITAELDDRPFSMRDFRVEDVSGNRLGFGEPLS